MLKFKTFDSDRTGEETYLDASLEDFLPPDVAEKTQIATDMDGTMFNNDLGRLVFMVKLLDPKFWRIDPAEFKELLLPYEHVRVIKQGKQGFIDHPEMSISNCTEILGLHRDLCLLYKLMHTRINGTDLFLEDSIINEFAAKMIAFDKLIILLEMYLRAVFNNQLLMRVRFFGGHDASIMPVLTKDALSISQQHPERFITLQSHDDTREFVPQEIELPPIEFDRYAEANEQVRRVIARLVVENRAKICVVTTNLQSIANAAIAYSRFAPYFREDSSFGSRLVKNGNVYETCLDGDPVFGPEKVKLAERAAFSNGCDFKVAIGDNANNDGPMMKKALENNGLVFIVGEEFETIRNHFAEWFKQVESLPKVEQRILVVETL
ncbi:hypothetical protein ACFL21_04750 [Patescibacteria group bacterium]